MNRTRVKICGLTRREDVDSAVELGADAVGFVFYDKSPRSVSIEEAIDLTCGLPPFVSVVALFVNPGVDWVARVLNALPISMLQFHGEETPEFCEHFAMPYYKAFRMIGDTHNDTVMHGATSMGMLQRVTEKYRDASAILLDSYDSSRHGGTGIASDWPALSTACDGVKKPVILAGGLNSENVSSGVSIVHPYAVDVSSGVEESPGVKSAARIENFIKKVLSADE